MTEHPTLPPPVVVVGARLAGATTALLLARAGHDVLIVDRTTVDEDTLSTHAFFRPGVVQLQRLGLLDAVLDSGAPAIRSIAFHVGDLSMQRPVDDRAGVDLFVAPRRYALDQIVLDAARSAGARFEGGTSVVGVSQDEQGRVDGVELRSQDGARRHAPARFVVGADGLRSRVAASVRAPVVQDRGIHGSTHYAYVEGMDLDGYELFLAEGRTAGIFPTHDGQANVFVSAAADDEIRGTDRGAAFVALAATVSPLLAARLRAARFASSVRGVTGLPNHVRQAAGPGWALVGDAGYHRDPITGHGMTDALVHAELLARSLARHLRGEITEAAALAEYGAARDEALAPMFDLTCRFSALPGLDEVVGLQKEIERALEAEALELAARGPLALPALV